MRLGATTVTVLRRTTSGQDDYGNDLHTTEEIPVNGCYIHPRMSSEGSVDARNQVITGLWLYAPTGQQIRPTDAVRLDGTDYEIDGEPGQWSTPTGDLALQQVALKQVTG